jgi:hypothetical protein
VETLTRFQWTVLRLSLLLTAAACVPALLVDVALAKGLLLGWAAGTAGFGLKTLLAVLMSRTRRMNSLPGMIGMALRVMLYAVALYKAYGFDVEHFHGFAGAVLGLILVPALVMLVGYSELDLRRAAFKTD